MGGKFTFWEARAMHRSVTHLPRSANTRSHSHLFNPSAPRLGMACWLRKHKPRAAFWSLSAVLFCQAEAFLSSDTKCLLSFSPWDPHRLPPAAPCQPEGAGQLAGLPRAWQGDHSAQPWSSPLHCMQRAWAGEDVGNSGYRAGEWQRSPVRVIRTSADAPRFHTAYRKLLPTAGLSCPSRAGLKHSEK